MSKLSHPSDTFYKYPELYQLENKLTGQRILNSSSKEVCEKELKRIKQRDWKLAKDLVIIKLDRKEELQWTSK